MNNEFPPQRPPQHDFGRDLWRGIALTLGLHLLQAPFALYSKGVTLLFIGFSQVLYIIPAVIITLAMQRYGITVGLMIGAALTLLLNFGFCAALVTMPAFR